jgi:hypothetical protein
MQLGFATDYQTILERVDAIDPLKYGRTRNYVDGDVSYLSPYISRGVISTKQVLDHVMSKGFTINQIESFVKELCWRDYFQRVGQVKNLNEDIKHPQEPVSNHAIPSAILEASTGIEAIDTPAGWGLGQQCLQLAMGCWCQQFEKILCQPGKHQQIFAYPSGEYFPGQTL